MKRGFLIVNNFLSKKKFDEIYSMLLASAKEQGADLMLVKTGELLCETGGLKGAALPDFALFWDKDVALCKQIERFIPVFNCSSSIYACDNKIETAIALENFGVPAPKTVIAPKTFEGIGYSDYGFLDRAVEILGLPIVVKEAYGSFGKQVYLARTSEELKSVVSTLGYKDFLMQEFVVVSCGKDIRVNVVGGKVVCAMARENPYDFRSNITNGGRAHNVEVTPEQAEVAIAACRAVGADFAGVDIFFGKPMVCEINSNPHFKSTLDCTGVDISRNIIRHVLERV